MDIFKLLEKHEVLALLLIILCLALIYVLYPSSPDYTEESIKSMVLEDLENKYPADHYSSVDYEVLNMTQNEKGWYVKAKVGLNLDTPCPERIHLTYTYPETNFVTDPEQYVVTDCKTCIGQPGCVIIFKEQAIVASHTGQGTDNVQLFLNSHPLAKPVISKEGQQWIVIWKDDNESISVKISESGAIQVK